jgi:hypothetical protein
MSTLVVYVDEAGNVDAHHQPPLSGETPLFTLAAVGLPLADWRQRDREFFKLKRQFFPDEMGRPDRRDEEVEIKGRDLTSPRQRRSSRRREFNRRVLTYLRERGATTFASTFLKNSTAATSHRSLYSKALQILVERVSLHVAERPACSNAILIVDSRMKGPAGLDVAVARSHMSYIFGHQTGRTFTNILEAPLFADSRLTVGLQLADIVASNIYANHYHYYLRDAPGALDYSHAPRCWALLDTLQFKSVGQVDGRRIYGYRVVDLRETSAILNLGDSSK